MSRLVMTAPMRLCARGPSGTFTASTPAVLSAFTSASIFVASTPRGGTISTDVTKVPAANFAAKCDRLAKGTGSTPLACDVGGGKREGDVDGRASDVSPSL